MNVITHDLHTPAGFTAAWSSSVQHGSGGAAAKIVVDDLYCPRCGARRRVDFIAIRHPHPFGEMPRLAAVECRQCHAQTFGLYYQGPNGPDLVLVRDLQGGLSTGNTPEAVRYYLDQAARSEGSGARSAAIAMYRAALEQLLFEQGFTAGMLDAKIRALEAAIKAGTAPKWGPRLDTEFLRVVKELGNGAIHTNGGDVKKQAALDEGLLIEVRATFEALLDLGYEEPARDAARLAKLKAAATIVK